MIRTGHAERRGFTLIEVMIALAILAVVTSVIYASFNAVTTSINATRIEAEEARLRQFMQRSFSINFATVFVPADPAAYEYDEYQFIGISGTDSRGHADSIRFVSSAPIVGGGALPGDIKEVVYEVIDEGDEGERLFDNEDEEVPPGEEAEDFRSHLLQCTETPILQGNVQSLDSSSSAASAAETDSSYTAPMWTVPIETLDILYFDGTEWREEWDSLTEGRMPWAVHIKANFAKPESMREADQEAGYNLNDDPDFELIISIPAGLGVTLDQRDFSSATTGDDEEMMDDDGQDGGDSGNDSGNDSDNSDNAGPRSDSENNREN